MTLRRLWVLAQGLPFDSNFWSAMRAEHEKSLKPTVDEIRERSRHYEDRAKEAD